MTIIDRMISRIKYHFGICQQRGCWSRNTVACYLPNEDYTDTVIAAYYCHDHAHGAGFCWLCGSFNGGIESFEFLNGGLCDDCRSEYEHDDDYARDYDDGYHDDEWDDDDPCDDFIVYSAAQPYTMSTEEEIPF